MKLRCYLRGLGIGIIVTALLMGLSTKPAELSDAEIIAKAKQLGMIDGTATLAEEAEKQLEQLEQNKEAEASPEETQKENIQENTEDNAEEETENPTENLAEDLNEESGKSALEEKLEEDLLGIRETGDEEELPMEEEESSQSEESSEDELPSGDEQPSEDEQSEVAVPEAETSYTLEIRGGDTSVSVSRKLVELGLVADASEYDRFLCQNGYDKKICTGTYEIKSGATYEEIAVIITKRN